MDPITSPSTSITNTAVSLSREMFDSTRSTSWLGHQRATSGVARISASTSASAAVLAEILATPEVARWWPNYDVERVLSNISLESDTAVFVIEVDGEVIGSIQYVEEPSPDYRHASVDVYLHPDWHGKGLGTDAVRTLARHLLHDRGHHRLAIDPAVDNERAIRTYKRVGFRVVGVMRAYE